MYAAAQEDAMRSQHPLGRRALVTSASVTMEDIQFYSLKFASSFT